MKCPYDPKVNACIYLEKMTQDNRKYECPDCSHYSPKTHYYDNPERERAAIMAISVCFIAIIAAAFTYLVVQGIKLIISWLQ